MVFTIKYRAFRFQFSHHPILWFEALRFDCVWTLWGKAIDKFFEAGLEVQSQGQGGLQMCEKLVGYHVWRNESEITCSYFDVHKGTRVLIDIYDMDHGDHLGIHLMLPRSLVRWWFTPRANASYTIMSQVMSQCYSQLGVKESKKSHIPFGSGSTALVAQKCLDKHTRVADQSIFRACHADL